MDLDNLNLDKIITDEFIAKNTTLASVKAFVDKSGYEVKSIVDVYLKSISSLDSWKDMLMKAVL